MSEAGALSRLIAHELSKAGLELNDCPQCAIEIKVRKDAGLSIGNAVCKMCGERIAK